MYSTRGTHQQVLDLSSVVELTPADRNITGVMIQALDQNVRMTVDSVTDAESDLGFRIVADQFPFFYPLVYGQTMSLIEETSGATLEYQWV